METILRKSSCTRGDGPPRDWSLPIPRPRTWIRKPQDVVERAVGIAMSYKAKRFSCSFALARGYEAMIHLARDFSGREIEQMMAEIKDHVDVRTTPSGSRGASSAPPAQ